jgi:hypothetical protein
VGLALGNVAVRNRCGLSEVFPAARRAPRISEWYSENGRCCRENARGKIVGRASIAAAGSGPAKDGSGRTPHADRTEWTSRPPRDCAYRPASASRKARRKTMVRPQRRCRRAAGRPGALAGTSGRPARLSTCSWLTRTASGACSRLQGKWGPRYFAVVMHTPASASALEDSHRRKAASCMPIKNLTLPPANPENWKLVHQRNQINDAQLGNSRPGRAVTRGLVSMQMASVSPGVGSGPRADLWTSHAETDASHRHSC